MTTEQERREQLIFSKSVLEIYGFNPINNHYEFREGLVDRLEQALKGLSPKEECILRIRWGFGIFGRFPEGKCHTLREIAKDFEVSPSRIWQIKTKAMRKLRHLNRSSFLIHG